MSQVPIFVINLEKSLDRREFICEQFKSFPAIEYQFFNAINGKENPDYPLFAKYNEKERFKRKGNTMNFSQLGCWASHYRLWEKCVELDTPIIVLEDDAILHSHFSEVYQFINSTENNFEFFWLSPPAPKTRGQKGKTILNIQNSYCKVERFYNGWGNTTGYFIAPHAAKKLLNYAKVWIYEVDITMERYWENKLDFLAITPFCLEPDLNKESNILVDKGKKNRTLIIRIRREIYKIKDLISKLTYNYKF
ncbi:TPA: glycosyltransferase family 25 protein [Mannheimia haemolytica]